MARNTAKPVQQYKGTHTQVANYTGPMGEIVVDTTDKRIVLADGTKGGVPHAKKSELPQIATGTAVGLVKPDTASDGITITEDGTLSLGRYAQAAKYLLKSTHIDDLLEPGIYVVEDKAGANAVTILGDVPLMINEDGTVETGLMGELAGNAKGPAAIVHVTTPRTHNGAQWFSQIWYHPHLAVPVYREGPWTPDAEDTTWAGTDWMCISTAVASTTTAGIMAPDGATIAPVTAGSPKMKVLPDGLKATNSTFGTVKPDGKALQIGDDGTLQVKPAPLGPDNYLEATDEGLVVKGVQTAENELWNCGYNGASKGSMILSTAEGDTKVNIVFDDVKILSSINKYNDPIASLGDDHSTFTILKSGTYHFSANINLNATVGNTQIVGLYKKVNTEWVLVTYGQPSLGQGSGVVSVDFDVHGRFNKGDILILGISSNTDVNFLLTHYVEFQLFADAALLAPALTTMKSELWRATLLNPTKDTGADIVGNAYKKILFTGIKNQTEEFSPLDNIVNISKNNSTAYNCVLVTKPGIYHIRLNEVVKNSASGSQNATIAIFVQRSPNSQYIVESTGFPITTGFSQGIIIDAHVRLQAGDAVFPLVRNITGLEPSTVWLELQLFPDTLEHPNHGVSTDAGNLASVGSDLGVMVSPQSVFYRKRMPDNSSFADLPPGIYWCNAWADGPEGDSKGTIIITEGEDVDGIREARLALFVNDDGSIIYQNGRFKGEGDTDYVWHWWSSVTAPRPHQVAGDGPGTWRFITSYGSSTPYRVTLPAGGTWACYLFGAKGDIAMYQIAVQVRAGGSVVEVDKSVTVLYGLIWRVA